MPSYANFDNLKDYLTRRCASQNPPISARELSLALGKSAGYIHAISNGTFLPSTKGADELAHFFGDSPKIVRILAGLELPPTKDDKIMAEIRELAEGLPMKARRELLAYAGYLRQKYPPTSTTSEDEATSD